MKFQNAFTSRFLVPNISSIQSKQEVQASAKLPEKKKKRLNPPKQTKSFCMIIGGTNSDETKYLILYG